MTNNKWKNLLAILLPWASMLSIEKNGVAFATFFLQLTVIGWIPAAIWARSVLKTHLEEERAAEVKIKPEARSKTDESSQEIIKTSKATAVKKTAATKKPKTTATKKTTSAKPKAKAKAKPKT